MLLAKRPTLPLALLALAFAARLAAEDAPAAPPPPGGAGDDPAIVPPGPPVPPAPAVPEPEFAVEKKTEELSLIRGDQRTLNFKSLDKLVKPSSPEVCTVDLSTDQRTAVLKANGAGKTVFIAIEKQGRKKIETTYKIEVLLKDPNEVVNNLKTLLDAAGVTGVQLKVHQNKVIVSGQPDKREMLPHIQTILAQEDSSMIINFLGGPNTETEVKETLSKLEQALKEIKGPYIERIGDQLWVKGKVFTDSDWEKVNAIKGAFGGAGVAWMVEKDDHLVVVKDNIHMTFYFVEHTGDQSQNLGVEWSDPKLSFEASGGGSGANPFKGLTTSFKGSVEAVIHIQSKQGNLHLHDRHEINVPNNEEGEYLAGGEIAIPIPVQPGGGGGGLEKVSFGVNIKVKPKLDETKNMRVDLTIENATISAIDPVTGYITKASNRYKTAVFLKEGDTFAIAGFEKALSTDSTTGVPGLKNLPVIGGLFRSKAFMDQKSRVVCYIVPRVVTPESDINRRMIEGKGPTP